MAGGEKVMGIDELVETEDRLRRRFLEEARVTDPEKGYISVPSVNQRINLCMQGLVADLIVGHFRDQQFDAVVGIPNSGIPLATSVAERMDVPLAPGRKGRDFPGAWRMPITIEEEIPSFTTGVPSTFVFNGIKEGDTVLAVEDVIATGSTLELFVKAMRERGITVYIASYFAKIFQGGVDKLKDLEVSPFYAIGIADIVSQNGEWELQLSPPHFSSGRNEG